MLRYLEAKDGDIEIKASQLKDYIGRKIEYLTSRDIDKSGRGYFFPKRGVIEGKYRHTIIVNGNYMTKSSFVEIVLLKQN